MDSKLVMTFQPNTIKHLGVKMYSTVPPALAELIANAYDAGASKVEIDLIDRNEKKIIVKDDGIGMTFDEVNDYFLRIGRNRREEDQPSVKDRKPTGKKGLGKLALFGLGDNIEIITTKNGETVIFHLDWNEIQNWKSSNYEPKFEKREAFEGEIGTTIILTNLKRKTGFPLDEYVESLAKLFDFKDDFKVYLSLNNSDTKTIDNKTKYDSIKPEFEWDIQNIIDKNENEYEFKGQITGKVVTTEKPLKPNLRGITLFANGRLINTPEFFVESDSSHFYSYATGWLNVDFIDNFEEDVISTNRQSIDWEHPKTISLRGFLSSCILIIEREWRDKRKQQKQKRITEKTKIDIEKWYSTLPENIQNNVESIVNIVDNTAQIPEETQQETIEALYRLVPEYAMYHWRYLHESVKDASYIDYKNQDYYRSVEESIKRFENKTQQKSCLIESGRDLMAKAYGKDKILRVAVNYRKTDGTNFNNDTIENVEEGQKFLAMGTMSGVRNPLSHEEIKQLRDSGLFSEKDCLDMLSLISHLFRRLDDV